MIGVLQLSLPVVFLLGFLQFKLNHDQKRMFFKIPIVWTSTILSLLIGHLAPGVMGYYAALFCDILLYPGILLLKKIWQKKENSYVPQPLVLRPLALGA